MVTWPPRKLRFSSHFRIFGKSSHNLNIRNISPLESRGEVTRREFRRRRQIYRPRKKSKNKTKFNFESSNFMAGAFSVLLLGNRSQPNFSFPPKERGGRGGGGRGKSDYAGNCSFSVPSFLFWLYNPLHDGTNENLIRTDQVEISPFLPREMEM